MSAGQQTTLNGDFSHSEPRYKDGDWLEKKYIDERLSIGPIADICGVSGSTIWRWLKIHDIPIRGKGHPKGRENPQWQEYACSTISSGYRVWLNRYHGEQDTVKVHRLAAVAWFGLDAVKGKVIHHKNGFKLDNRESNLEPTNPVNHGRVSRRE